ncbi:NUDIX domain-containing protein [Nocardia yamanashiensis]|uniref:NUDIX hydrolase n=1 Tax=Nocardia yamanashiensis TaxID=209247 RepID=UPI001E54C455|nr:NUDIX domain-containing protein [Nocardia yamanashiensis]UGT43665.1 NUDIX domain-containing protein [Nocardia yamanashiensis]
MAYTSFVDVLLIATRDDRVLLARRANTGYGDGLWNVPSGKLEPDEDVEAAVIREAKEEIGISLHRNDIRMSTVLHYRPPGGPGRVGFFFHATTWQGEPFNAEPHKCSELRWFPLDALPADTVPYITLGLDHFRRGLTFGVAGWPVM